MNKAIEQTVEASEANIGRLAYQLWEKAGRPAGRDLEFWLAAEAEVRAASRPALVHKQEAAPTLNGSDKSNKTPRVNRGGIKKTWPKPYPSLPKF